MIPFTVISQTGTVYVRSLVSDPGNCSVIKIVISGGAHGVVNRIHSPGERVCMVHKTTESGCDISSPFQGSSCVHIHYQCTSEIIFYYRDIH